MSVFPLLEQAAAGSFPSDSGEIEVLPSPSGSCDAVVALTGHSIVAAGVTEGWVEERVPRDDLTGPMRPDFVAALAAELGTGPGSIDVLLAAPGLDSPPAVELCQVQGGDARTRRARRYRSDIRSYADRDSGGVVNLGRGLNGRLDLSIELPAGSRSAGRGREIIEAARALVPRGEFLFASIAPGNARCLRAALAGGFVPIGAEVLFLVRPLSQNGEA
jgi:hypothetical protein